MTARFWVYDAARESNVRLSLSEGQSITVARGGPTDEGYSYDSDAYRLEGDTVIREYESDGRDCDGRLSRSGVLACRVDALDAHEFDGVGYPCWDRLEGSQRDYSAEAQGY